MSNFQVKIRKIQLRRALRNSLKMPKKGEKRVFLGAVANVTETCQRAQI